MASNVNPNQGAPQPAPTGVGPTTAPTTTPGAQLATTVANPTQTSNPIIANPTNVASQPTVSNIQSNATTTQGITTSLGLAAPSKTDTIIATFLKNLPPPAAGKDPDKYLQTGDTRFEQAVADLLADPSEPNKTFSGLFKDRSEFESFFSVAASRLDKQRVKREIISQKTGKSYEGMNKSTVESQMKGAYDDVVNGKVEQNVLDEAKQALPPPSSQPKPSVAPPKPQAAQPASTPFANFKNNEKALIQKFIEVTFPNKPKDTDTFLAVGNDLEDAIDKQITSSERYLRKYEGLVDNEDQLKAFLSDLKRFLELEGRKEQLEFNSKPGNINKTFAGVTFAKIKDHIEKRVFDLADNQLLMNTPVYIPNATGGQAIVVYNFDYINAKTLLFIKKSEIEIDHLSDIHTHQDHLESHKDGTLASILDDIKHEIADLKKKMAELTKEQFAIELHQFYEQYKELIFERKIREGLMGKDDG